MASRSRAQEFSLYSTFGVRKYLNRQERERALASMATLRPDRALLCLTYAWTGARVSEALALVPLSFQIDRCIVALPILKRRRPVVREVPLPPWLMGALDEYFKLREAQRDPLRANRRLWPEHRVTAWRIVKHAMMLSQIVGPAACPRGLRHSFAVGALQATVPLNFVQKWLGHARITTTAIYVDACGPEEQAFAARFWGANDNDHPYGRPTR